MKDSRTFSIPTKSVLPALGGLAALSALLSLCLGAVPVAPGEVLAALLGRGSGPAAQIVLYARLPRTCGCLLAGAALGGVLLVLFIGSRTGASKMTLVLAGVAVSGMFSAGIDAVLSFFPDALNGYTDFRVGGVANLSMSRVSPAFWVILAAALLALSLAGELDVLLLGEETARSLGLPARRLRLILLALAAALAGAAVSFAGLLGFVGLIAPHMVRRLVGEARTLFAPYELPVGVVLSLLGGPFFLWLLLRQRRGRGSGYA